MKRPKCGICHKAIWSDYYETFNEMPVHDDCAKTPTGIMAIQLAGKKIAKRDYWRRDSTPSGGAADG